MQFLKTSASFRHTFMYQSNDLHFSLSRRTFLCVTSPMSGLFRRSGRFKYRSSWYSSIQTRAIRTVLMPCVSLSLGKLYGWNSRKIWPILEHGIVSRVPPHCQILKLCKSEKSLTLSWLTRQQPYHLEILSAPAVHLLVVRANLPEVVT